MTDSFYIGTAPFCKPSKAQCEKTPGYVADGYDDCGDGSCCWSGQKIKCSFNPEKWQQSQVYSELLDETPEHANVKPQFAWFGKAPFCKGTPCDVYQSGMIPIRASNCGDGSCCVTGEKWLGMKPISKRDRDALAIGMVDCYEYLKLEEKTMTEALKLGNNVVDTIREFKNTGVKFVEDILTSPSASEVMSTAIMPFHHV